MRCVVPGCGAYHSRNHLVKFHTFPRDEALCKLWLTAIRHPEYNASHVDRFIKEKILRVCSDHFLPTDYSGSVQYFSRLKSGAVPSVFPFVSGSGDTTEKVQPSEIALPTTSSRRPPQTQVTPVLPCQMPLLLRFKLSSPVKTSRPVAFPVFRQPGPSGFDLAINPALEKREKTLESLRVPIPAPTTECLSDSESLADSVGSMDLGASAAPSPQKMSTPMSKKVRRELVLETGISSEEDIRVPHDSTFQMSTLTTSSTDATSSKSSFDSPSWKERKWIVSESKIMDLFKLCNVCQQSIEETKRTRQGGMLRIKWMCIKGHSGHWTSCPSIRGLPEINLLSASAILFTGATFTAISDWACMMNLQLLSRTTFYCTQSTYLLPVIEQHYHSQKDDIITDILHTGLGIQVCGDGRSDSPGHNAKYTTYSLMEDTSKRVIHFELVQVTEATSSVAMEAIGFERAMKSLLDHGVKLDCVTTDRSPSIRKRMREKFPDIKHEFDPWHVDKGLKKKLIAQGNKRSNRELLPWVKAVSHHLWFCCSSCNGDAEELLRRWKSLLYHICGIHSWVEGGVERKCYHGELPEDDDIRKRYLSRQSEAYKVLTAIVLDKSLLKDLRQMTMFKHTGELEVFHSAMLKYTPKRIHFKYPVMRARTMLAVVDHNTNVTRQQATTAKGEDRYRTSYSKQTKQWVAKKIYEGKSHQFRDALFDKVLERRMDETIRFEDSTSRVSVPSLPPNIATVEKLPKDLLIAQHRSRFEKK